MQATSYQTHSSSESRAMSFASIVFGIVAISALGALVLGTDVAAVKVRDSLVLCVRSVIPSIFPLAVIANMLSLGSGGEVLGRLLGKPLKLIFGVSENAALAVVLGFICGFPIGAVAASKLYARGLISKGEFCRLMTFINNPSATFVINAVGASMLGSRNIGIAIYICVLLSACLTGIISRFFIKDTLPSLNTSHAHAPSFSSIAVSSVSSAATAMLNVCAYAVFFSAFVGVLSSTLSAVSLPEKYVALFFGIFELVGGVGEIARVGGNAAPFATAAICSWSGLSVMMQIASVCNGKVSLTPMVISKLLQALLSPLLLFICIGMFI